MICANKVLKKRLRKKKIPNTSRLVKTTDYNTKIAKIENHIPGITGLVTTTSNTKATEIVNKAPNINNLDTKSVLDTKSTEIENKVLDTNTLIRKTNFNTKFTGIANKIPIISRFYTELRSINPKVTSNKTK